MKSGRFWKPEEMVHCLEWGQLQVGMFYLFGNAAGCKFSSRTGAVFPL